MKRLGFIISGIAALTISTYLLRSHHHIKIRNADFTVKKSLSRRELVFISIGNNSDLNKLYEISNLMDRLGFHKGALRSNDFRAFMKFQLDAGATSFSKYDTFKDGSLAQDVILYGDSSDDVYVQMCFEGKFPTEIAYKRIGAAKKTLVDVIIKEMKSHGFKVVDQNSGNVL